jgi:UDP-N-acetylglucosamine enolpyruvyl transferase
MLNRMGAKISGIGSNMLNIEGVESLKGTEHRLLPDMIEVGSFIGMAAMVGNGIRIKDVSLKDLGIIPDAFRRLGVKVKVDGDDLYIPHQKHYVVDSFIDGTIMTLADAPCPGLTPDLLSVLIVVATHARGSVLFHQVVNLHAKRFIHKSERCMVSVYVMDSVLNINLFDVLLNILESFLKVCHSFLITFFISLNIILSASSVKK